MTRIDKLLAAMTLEEKIGQLNMAAAGRAVTGPVLATGVIEGIRAGRIGSLLNIWGAREVHAVQKIAVEKARLGIPLLIGVRRIFAPCRAKRRSAANANDQGARPARLNG
jgi:beta-glucosidase